MFCYHLQKLGHPPDIPVTLRNTPQDESAIPHQHDYIEICVVCHGHGIHLLHDDSGRILESSIIKGDVFTILPGEVHSYKQCSKFRLYNICIDAEYLAPEAEKLKELEYYNPFFNKERKFEILQLHLPPANFRTVELVLKRLRAALNSTRKSRCFSAKLALLEFILAVFDGDFKNWKYAEYRIDDKLFDSIAELESAPEKNFNIASLARKAGMSLSGYSHKFKEAVGMSPSKYCINLRLDSVKHSLETSCKTVYELAQLNGFYDANSLIRLFKKRYGVTPSAYRNSFRSI